MRIFSKLCTSIIAMVAVGIIGVQMSFAGVDVVAAGELKYESIIVPESAPISNDVELRVTPEDVTVKNVTYDSKELTRNENVYEIFLNGNEKVDLKKFVITTNNKDAIISDVVEVSDSDWNYEFNVTAENESVGYYKIKTYSAPQKAPLADALKQLVMTIDTPTINQVVGDSINISGWALYSTDGYYNSISRVEILLDNVVKGDAEFFARTDLAASYPGYGDYSNAGFKKDLTGLNLTAGTHTITVRIWDYNYSVIRTENRIVTRQTSVGKPLVYSLDTPSDGQVISTGSVNVSGWALYTADGVTDGISKMEVLVDNISKGSPSYFNRPDLPAALPGYPQNSYLTGGFTKVIDTNALSHGLHTISVIIYNRNNVAILNTSRMINVLSSKSKPFIGVIDSPAVNEVASNNVTVGGWAIYSFNGETSAVSRVEIFLDDRYQGEPAYFQRNDVAAANPGYGDYSRAGFSKTISLANLSQGIHNIIAKVYDTNGQLIEAMTRPFNVQNNLPQPLAVVIDTPQDNQELTDAINISGWALCTADGRTSSISRVEVLIDGISQGNASRFYRPDLESGVPGYGEYSLGGFKKDIYTTGLPNGHHIITVKIWDRNNHALGTVIRHITTVAQNTRPLLATLDTPVFNQLVNNVLNVSGWAIYSTDGLTNGISRVEVFVGNNSYGSPAFHYRPDVQQAFPDYGDYANSGFSMSINTNGLAVGDHNVFVKIYDKNNIEIGTLTTVFRYSPTLSKPLQAQFETPIQNQVCIDRVDISGWALYTMDGHNNAIHAVEIVLDGVPQGQPTYHARQDLYTACPGYGDYSAAGFFKTIDTTNLITGNHTIVARFIDINGQQIGQISRDVNIQQSYYKPFVGVIDTPGDAVVPKNFNVAGWALYTTNGVNSAVSRVEIIIDGKTMSNATFFARPDLQQHIGGYGDYSKAGYTANINASTFETGKHILSVRIWSTNNAALGVLHKEINIQ